MKRIPEVNKPLDREQLIEIAEKEDLIYTQDTIPGITRMPSGKSFKYYTPDGSAIAEGKIKERIENLVIPPAWQHVWISPLSNSHLQATGIDEKGRKQYLYHKDWIALTQQNKFDKVLFFSQVLPEIRKTIRAGMEERGLTKRKILSTIVWLLENTYIRIGNPEYAKENESYGLTTLRNRHVDVSGDTVTLSFKGKSGVYHDVDVHNAKVARIIHRLEELPGYELFQYVDGDGGKHQLHSQDVNDFLCEITGEHISAKDFRTWGGTVLAGKTLYEIGPYETKTAAKKNVSQAVKTVSKHLRNTPSTCRSYYIHPTVIESYEKKVLIPHFEEIQKRGDKPDRLTRDEYAVVTLIQSA